MTTATTAARVTVRAGATSPTGRRSRAATAALAHATTLSRPGPARTAPVSPAGLQGDQADALAGLA